jgi:hypothetical protein
MNKKLVNLLRIRAKLAELFDGLVPEEIAEAEAELQELGLDPSRVGDKLELAAAKAITERILREHSGAVRARKGRTPIDLTNKLN